MKDLHDTVWQRRGVSWIWENDAFSEVTKAKEVFSLREMIHASKDWPDDLPSNDGNTLVVAGLDACLDLLSPANAEEWLADTLKYVILSFQDFYQGDAALVFWLPVGQRRLQIQTASDTVTWKCSAPSSGETLDFGRLLWGDAQEYPQKIILVNGNKPAGLFHLRIS